mgnify:CR=1 FL=1
MTESKDIIVDEVVSTAERIEESDDLQEMLGPCGHGHLDVKVVAGLDGEVREVIVILTVGGPYIEVNLSKGSVFGSWGGETHDAAIFKNEEQLKAIEAQYVEYWDDTVRA